MTTKSQPNAEEDPYHIDPSQIPRFGHSSQYPAEVAQEAARAAGRQMAGVVCHDALREAMADVALAGAIAALRVQPVAPGGGSVPATVRAAAERRTTKGKWHYGRRILWERSTVEDRTFARECVNYVVSLLEAEKSREGPMVATITGLHPSDRDLHPGSD